MPILSSGEPLGGEPMGGSQLISCKTCPEQGCQGDLIFMEKWWECSECNKTWTEVALRKLEHKEK